MSVVGVRLADVIKAASATTLWSEDQIVGPRRHRPLMRVRQAIYMLGKDRLRMSYAEIGRRLSGRNHATVIHGAEEARFRQERDKAFATLVNSIMTEAKRIADERRASISAAVNDQ